MNQLPEDDMLRHFWQDSKKEAPMGFSDAIMQNLPQARPLPEALKKPLLSLKAAGMLTGLIAVLAFLISWLPSSDGPAAPSWYQMLQQGLEHSLGWLNANTSFLPILAMLSAAVVLLIFIDQLIQRFMQRTVDNR